MDSDVGCVKSINSEFQNDGFDHLDWLTYTFRLIFSSCFRSTPTPIGNHLKDPFVAPFDFLN